MPRRLNLHTDRSTFSALLIVAMLAAACAPGESGPAVIARDSAGIRIVELNADAITGTIDLTSAPSWSVGGDDEVPGALTLFAVSDLTLASDDELLIAEASTQQVIRVRLADGRFERFGGAGDGPLEFRGLRQVYATRPEHFAAYDARRRRFVELGPDGALVAETAVPLVQTGAIEYLQPLAAGGFVLGSISGFGPPGQANRYRGRSPIVRIREGTLDTLTVVPGKEMFTGELLGGVVYGATSIVAGTPDGVWLGDTARPEVGFWSGSGAQGTIVRWRTREPRAIGRAERDALWALLAAAVPKEERAAFQAAQSQIPFADTMPAFGTLVADGAGRVWIGSPVGPEREMLNTRWPAQRWIVVDPSLPVVFRAQTPEGFRLIEAAADYVVGVFEDELGRESVRLYPITARRSDEGM
jgi:hypothetical protein